MFGIAQRGRFGINFALHFADASRFQNTEAFGVSSHDPVFNTVMDDLDEMPGAIGPAMQIALFGCPAEFLPARCSCDVANPRSQRSENRIQSPNDICLAPDHHAVAAFKAPNAATRSDINVMNTFRREFLCATDVVHVIGVPSVDDGIARLEKRQKIAYGLVDGGSGNHQPNFSR